MNANDNGDMKNDEYSFIQEKIVPKAKNTKKKLVRYVCFTILLGVIFGGVSSLVFHGSSYFFSKCTNSEQKKRITLEKDNQELPIISEKPKTSVLPSESVEEIKKIEDMDIYRAYDIKSYQKQYELMRSIADKFRYSMVTVSAIRNITGWFEMENSEDSYGAVIRKEDDYIYILCNYDKIKDVQKIEVSFYNNEKVSATFVMYNKNTSIALLKIKSKAVSERTRGRIEGVKLGELFQSAAGVPVLGLGQPDGTLGSMIIGYVTAPRINKYVVDGKLTIYHTNIMENAYAEGFFVNLSGEVVGFITHRYKEKSDQNIMSFLGAERLKGIIQGMLNEKEQAYLGIKVCEISSNNLRRLNVDYGVYITDVIANSPAFKKGLLVGDVITDIDGVSISSVAALMQKLSEKEPSDEIELQITRQTKVEYPKISYAKKKVSIKLR